MNSVSLGEEDIAWSIVYLCRRETRAGTSSYCSDNSRRPDARPHARPRSRPRVALARGWLEVGSQTLAEGGARLELDVGDSSYCKLPAQQCWAFRSHPYHKPITLSHPPATRPQEPVPKPSHRRPSATTCLMCAQHAAPFDHHLLFRDTHQQTPSCLSSLSPRLPPDILHPLQLSSRCDKDTCTTVPVCRRRIRSPS